MHALPDEGLPADEVLAEVRRRRSGDADWRGGRVFSLVYANDDPELERLLHEVVAELLHENALNPGAVPSVRAMEAEVVAWTADLLGDPSAVGTVTTGGTDSIHLAVKVGRDHARQVRGVAEPVLVTPDTCHPAFDKAAQVLDVEQARVPVGADGRVDVDAMAATVAQLDGRAAMVVASAPCYPYGTFDDVPAVAALASSAGILCHVDACLGGYLSPFWEALGRPLPPWDLRVPGVTSISADTHKYGYTVKGASVLLHRTKDLLRLQRFRTDAWPGGLYASPGSAGTRPASQIAAAWAAMRHLGRSGYLGKARMVADAVDRITAGVAAIDGLEVAPAPDLATFQVRVAGDAEGVAAAMAERGWHLDRQPGGLHLIVMPAHARIADELVADLAAAVAERRAGEGRAAGYAGAEEPR